MKINYKLRVKTIRLYLAALKKQMLLFDKAKK